MTDPSLRLLLLLRHISREPQFISTQQLRERLADAGHEVSLRTIQRDLQMLSTHFPLIQNTPQGRGKAGLGWAFLRNTQNISLPLMGNSAALTLAMAVQHLQPLLPGHVIAYLEPLHQEAKALLNGQDSRQYQGWIDKVRIVPQQVLQPPTVDGQAVEGVYQALLQNRQISANYKGIPERIIHPYGLVQQGHVLYLICRFYEYDDIRITALHRYTEVQVLDETVRAFPEFKIDDYLDEGAMLWPEVEDKHICLQLRIDRWLAEHLHETPLSDNQQIRVDAKMAGCFQLKADVLDSLQLRRWLLSQGTQVEILKPDELRNWMREVVREQAEKYSF
ncbi:helix-turn-helix transcriptional regulator [Halopseudomonas xiamenensis]|uniref:helix-turn-helix transcriptional regulator n=1 Tax=Halopseudomonas xiamenensis TaxID=157792 RepID=UPI001624F01C|nr:WYL domain-containing protein [Halopseudomonas xiamenensis]